MDFQLPGIGPLIADALLHPLADSGEKPGSGENPLFFGHGAGLPDLS